ncbi:hypothetical protein P4576_25550 [Peribacillus frigoritolerans]|nr:hypothetical protein [Peribacillus frigoritolerans]MED3790534.1 hypothetical protein [Peribacillus frigoritolerans]
MKSAIVKIFIPGMEVIALPIGIGGRRKILKILNILYWLHLFIKMSGFT